MRKLLFVIVLALVIVSAGCNREKHSVSVTIPVEEFTSVVCNCPIKITFSKQASQVVLTGEDDVVDDFILEYGADKSLTISLANLLSTRWDERPWVVLPMPEKLSKIKAYSMVELNTDAPIVTDSLFIDLSGSSFVSDFNVDVNYLYLKSWGYSTNNKIAGQAKTAEIELHSTKYDASSLSVDNYSCILWTSTATFLCNTLLYVDVAQSSTIEYLGDCAIKTNNVFNSSINKIEK